MNSRFASGLFTTFLISMLMVSTAHANTAEQIFVQVSPSVVVVDVIDSSRKIIGLGSGAVIGIGQVITNCHVALKGKSLRVRQSGKTFKAELQYADPDRDLCQLSVPALQAPSVALGTANKLRVGQRVYAIGAPEGLELTLSEGLISSLRKYEGSQYIQTSAAISPGSSGGGLFDDQGRLVGITAFQLIEGQNLNFALPVDWIAELPKRSQARIAKLKLEATEATSQESQPGRVFKDCPNCPEMVAIPGKNYALGKYLVTQKQWREVMGNNPSFFRECGDNCPVEQVSWSDVQKFILKLNRITSKQYRLPTRAEWKFACYGGKQTRYCGSNDINEVAWYEGNSGGRTHPVGLKKPNDYGLYDMEGNVWQWGEDLTEGYCDSDCRISMGRTWGTSSFGNVEDGFRPQPPEDRDNHFGFRLARTLP